MRVALALISGALLGISFPKFGISLASLIALVPLLLALQPLGTPSEGIVSGKRAFWLGYLTGAVFFLILLYWIPLLPRENVTIPFSMYPALLLLVAYLSLYPGLAALVSTGLARRGVPIGLALPLVWTLLEALRGSGTFGFPWGSLGYAMAPYPHLIQFAEYVGVWGVTLWVALVSGMLHTYLSSRWVGPKLISLAAILVLVLAPYFHGRQVLSARLARPGVDVGIVQPNIGKDKWLPAVRDSVIETILDHTRALALENTFDPPEIILWPETAIPARLTRDPVYGGLVNAMVDSIRIPVLAGFPDGERLPDGSIRFANSAALIRPEFGVVAQYDKRHLVPFSENFPLPFLNRFDFGQANFSRGSTSGLFTDLETPFGVLICFESIFPGQAREVRALGARYLVNITNDQWFGDSAAPVQHFYMNVLRTIENRCGMVRAANTGISGSIDPYGIVHERTGTFVPARIVVSVELGGSLTVYTRFGDWILIVCGISTLALFGSGWWRARKESG